MKWLLTPIAWLFAAISYVRWALYRWGLFLHSKSAPAPVISVGNIAVGGTGKTPCVIWLARGLKEKGFDPVILSRGYGRQTKNRFFLMGDIPQAKLAGDEPALIARRLPVIPIVVHKDRIGSAKEVGGGEKRVFILDDGFQHLKLKRDFDVVLLPADDPFSGGYFLPLGRLRDGLWRLADADAIVLVGERDRIPDRLLPYRDKIYHAEKLPISLRTLNNAEVPMDSLRGERVVAFSAIGDPASFHRTIAAIGAQIVAAKNYRDHHSFIAKDIRDIETLAAEHDADILITTDKDAVRLAALRPRLATYVMGIEFLPCESEILIDNIINSLPKKAKRL